MIGEGSCQHYKEGTPTQCSRQFSSVGDIESTCTNQLSCVGYETDKLRDKDGSILGFLIMSDNTCPTDHNYEKNKGDVMVTSSADLAVEFENGHVFCYGKSIGKHLQFEQFL